ncbi:unnamed protein product [Eruca vesicaria subsp. sativa]|uniref:Uncharacterized protein n=1 Tax=Eruca vesicaria subsp. sativa TaxID=29727 RepID=A0ABC8IQD8_ERUVS|nr:unnamed protein product [Eruca vesicaria subsp. sativa]
MVRDIKNSLEIMSSRRELIHSCRGDPLEKQIHQYNINNNMIIAKAASYFRTVFKSAQQKASNIKWPHPRMDSSLNMEINELEEVLSKGEHMVETTKFEEFKAGKESSLSHGLEI